MTLAELDIFFRGVAIGGLLVVLSAFVREFRQTPAVGYGIAFIASVIAYLAASFPGDLGDLSFLRFAAFPLAAAAMPLFWMFSRAWYDDDFRPGWREYGVACFVVTLTILHEFVFPGFGELWSDASFLICQISAFAFAGDALRRVWVRRADDLVEARRRARPIFVGSIAAYAFVVTIADSIYGWTPGLRPWVVVNIAGIALLVVLLSYELLRVGEFGTFPRRRPTTDAAPAPDADYARLAARLDQLMTQERVYREDGLVIAALAQKMNVQEYRLRRLINQHLGYRNFNAYLNGYRIEDAKRSLEDPDQRQVPILTIALDAGFSSLGPFNRAFKGACGLTPSEYRRQELRKLGELDALTQPTQ
ncbi:MAG: helix-turn-helix domain-containing protein [Methylocystis silviterrae]|uniref:AraC family transcriptional regulator n=1 Tax=Methylocystis silviterrae TaxID=2743612 RepID=UPI003C784178